MTNIENTCYNSQSFTVFPQVASFLFMPKQNARKMPLALCPTTLLKLLTNHLHPNEGKVTSLKSIVVGYLEQDIDFQDKYSLIEEMQKVFGNIEKYKKDFENLSESELRELKESIEDVLEAKKFRGRYIKTNQKGIGIAWIIIAIIISVYRYFTL